MTGVQTCALPIFYSTGATSADVTSLYGTVPTGTFGTITAKTHDYVSFNKGYKADTTVKTLFNWAETSADLSVGVGSNITLTLGFDISAYGWESLDFGFDFTF